MGGWRWRAVAVSVCVCVCVEGYGSSSSGTLKLTLLPAIWRSGVRQGRMARGTNLCMCACVGACVCLSFC